MENPKEIQRLLDQNLKAPPKQLKSNANSLPVSPFKTYEDKMKIINAGVSAGAGIGTVHVGVGKTGTHLSLGPSC